MINNNVDKNNSYFDKYGRCIPTSLVAAVHNDSRRYFSIVQPQVDYHEIYHRLNNSFNFSDQLSVGDFQQRAEAILHQICDEDKHKKLTAGVGVPFILPQAEYNDIGEAFQDIYLNAVEKSFQQMFPAHSFDNYYKDSLVGKLSITSGVHQEYLMQAMKKGVVVGYYFPCLLEYSVPAAIERMESLPDNFILAGGFDTAAAFIGSPNLLTRADGYPPLLWLSGFSCEDAGAGFHFEAYGYDLTFNRRMHLGKVAEYWASGLILLG